MTDDKAKSKRGRPAKQSVTEGSNYAGDLLEANMAGLPKSVSPAQVTKANIKMQGGVTEKKKSTKGSMPEQKIKGTDLVEVDGIKRSVKDPVLGHLYPTEGPTKVSYSLAHTMGWKFKEIAQEQEKE